ncbi:hypothetical protein U1Q18_017487 [Sarracenia purpurea var. burkii]
MATAGHHTPQRDLVAKLLSRNIIVKLHEPGTKDCSPRFCTRLLSTQLNLAWNCSQHKWDLEHHTTTSCTLKANIQLA